MDQSITIFTNALIWFRENYTKHLFFVERDVVWTIQQRMMLLIQQNNLPYQVFNDYPMLPGLHRSFSTDIAIINTEKNEVELAIEFKYEPSHLRKDILKKKLPVVIWSEVEKDILRINEFVINGKTKIGISILIDEGGYFKNRVLHQNGRWEKWENSTWILSSSTDS